MESVSANSPDEWEALVNRSFYVLSVEAADERFRATTRTTELGRGVRLTEVTASGSSLARTRKLTASNPSDELLFLIQLSGRSRLEQGDRQIEIRAGEAAFCDPSVPYRIHCDAGQQIVAMVPRHSVLPTHTSAADIRLQPLSMGLAPLRILRLLAEEMASDPGMGSLAERDSVAGAATELLRSAAVLASSAKFGLRNWCHDTRLLAAKEFMLARLPDAGLTIEDVASAVNVSSRHLSNLFAPHDSPAAFLRRERLRRAREELLDPRLMRVGVGEIGARWGYPEPSTFGRAFVREFGETPSELRRHL